MDVTLVILLGMFVSFGLLSARELVKAREEDKTEVEWRLAAKKLGLGFSASPRLISGHLRGFRVTVEARQDGKELKARLVVDGAGWIDRDLRLRPEGTWTGLAKRLAGEDIELEDGEFDARVHLRGKESRVLALMTHAARKAVVGFVEQAGWVSEGQVQCELRDGLRRRLRHRAAVALRIREGMLPRRSGVAQNQTAAPRT